jgi:hypothetical protein
MADEEGAEAGLAAVGKGKVKEGGKGGSRKWKAGRVVIRPRAERGLATESGKRAR